MCKDGVKLSRRLSVLLAGLLFCVFAIVLSSVRVNAQSNISWQQVAAGEDMNLISITYGNGLYVGIDWDNVLKISADAVNWTERVTGVSTAVWNGKTFVAGGPHGKVVTSTDGVTWEKGILENENIQYGMSDIIWDGKQFVATANSDQGGAIFTSPDGLAWTCWISVADQLRCVAWNGSVYVASASSGKVYTSNESVYWKLAEPNYTNNFKNITSNGKIFVATGYSGQVMASPDGVNWTVKSLNDELDVSNVLWDGKQFVVTASSYPSTSGKVFSSPDGQTWTQVSYINDWVFSDITYNNGKYLAVGPGYVCSTEDLKHWSYKLPMQYYSSACNGDTIVIAGSDGTLKTSKNGVDWTSAEPQNDISIEDIICDGEKFIAVGGKGTILLSHDGTAWSKMSTDTTEDIYSVAWNGKIFIAVATNNVILKSTDGYTWKSEKKIVYEGYSYNLYDVIWDGNRFVAVGGRDPLIGGTIVAVSPDGTDWTGKLAPAVLFSSIAYNGNCYVAGSGYGLFVSNDSDSWEKAVPNQTTFSVTWDGKRFITVGHNGETYTSTDGKSWIPGTSGVTVDLYTVSQFGNKYIAAGDKGTILLGTVTLPGDLNNDGNVDTLDLAQMRAYLLQIKTDINKNNADMNSDGVVDSLDFMLLKKLLL
jgi:Dockerin type I repeat.